MASIWTIRRSATDAKLTGLCAGVARHWGVDPLLVRVGWVLFALSGGVGLVLYAAGWLLIPQDDEQSSTLDTMTGGASARWPREAWIAVVVIACLVTLGLFGSLTGFSFGPAVVLAFIWYFGYYKTRSKRSGQPSSTQPSSTLPSSAQPTPPAVAPFHYPGPATPFTQAAEAWHQRMAEHLHGGSSPAPGGGSPAPTTDRPNAAPPPPVWPGMPVGPAPRELSDPVPSAPPISAEQAARAAYLATPDPVGLYGEPEKVSAAAAPSRRVRSQAIAARRLRLVGLIVLGLTLAGLGLADAQGVAIAPATYLAAALLVIGLTLIAATWFGRARGILPVGLLVLVGLAGVTVVNPGGMPLILTTTVRYTSVAELPAAGNQLEVGWLKVDLSDLEVTRDVRYTAGVEAGAVDVSVPDDVNIVVHYTADQGVMIDDDTTVQSGSELKGVIQPRAPLAGRPTLTIDLSTGVGELRVTR